MRYRAADPENGQGYCTVSAWGAVASWKSDMQLEEGVMTSDSPIKAGPGLDLGVWTLVVAVLLIVVAALVLYIM